MKNIDFLPQRYRERYAARAAVLRRWAIVGGLAVVVTPLALYQYLSHARVVTEVVAIEGEHQEAVDRSQFLTRLKADLERARGEAALFAYLSHPWPRTQILAHLQEPLPESIRLTSIKMAAVPKASNGATRNRLSRRGNQPEGETDQRPPATRDFAELLQSGEMNEAIVTLNGVTADMTELHRYVAQLRVSGLFDKSELVSVESLPAQETGKSQKFEIRLVLNPGHGKLAKPTESAAQTAAPPPQAG